MAQLTITCDRCRSQIEHVCNEDLHAAAVRLLAFTPGFAPLPFNRRNDFYTPGDEFAPCFSEAWAYATFGKEHGRTFNALLNNVLRAAGLDPHALAREAHEQWEKTPEQTKYCRAQARATRRKK